MHIGFAKVYSSPSQHTDDIMQKVQYLFVRRKRKYNSILLYCKQRMKVKFTFLLHLPVCSEVLFET